MIRVLTVLAAAVLLSGCVVHAGPSPYYGGGYKAITSADVEQARAVADKLAGKTVE